MSELESVLFKMLLAPCARQLLINSHVKPQKPQFFEDISLVFYTDSTNRTLHSFKNPDFRWSLWVLMIFLFLFSALVSRASNSVQFRQLQLYKHEMQHFVKVIQGYIANQILHVTWCEFGNKLSSVGNLEEIHRTHAEYLNKAIFR